jgi:hypothetical protein
MASSSWASWASASLAEMHADSAIGKGMIDKKIYSN